MAEKRYVRAVNEALCEEMERDPAVCLLGVDVGAPGGPFGATRGLRERFGPQRVRDTPISEAAVVGLAIGAATLGLRPVVEIMFMDFLALVMDQLVNQAAKMRYMTGGQAKLPLVVRTQTGYRDSAGPQHAQSLEAWLTHVPGLKVVMPSGPCEAKGLLKAAIRDDNPVIVVENRTLYALAEEVPDGDYVLPLERAAIKREGRDVTIASIGIMVREALAAAEALAERGISCEVIDLRSANPLDLQTVRTSLEKTNRLVIAHSATRCGGVGAELAAALGEEAFYMLDAPITRVGAAFAPIPFSPPLERAIVPDRTAIIAAVEQVLAP
ncbi:pyruvate dehydrogenase subunit beta [Thermogemmatispora aurantia]|uniref:Pyruvate dehydrogenase subunit beta n=1 Tax=Thermogemmatispora aurantia TaxID=2045279 RepID=A0A5J4KC19_9CHLR|nr:alpha-ketoacid dehydrogenase subunit beta [Thermogemmatispora aurantia]GER83626.1 pyruvate dehydrogenase subunit beta [Thermogemmatispora aurantia]